MGSAAKGLLAVYMEPTTGPGRQVLLGPVAVSASHSLTVQPNAVNSQALMYMHIVVTGNTASGTVTVTGKKADGSTAVAETSTTLAAATVNSPTQEYGTSATFCTVNASGVTTSGLTNGVITVYGIYAATKLVPANFNAIEKFDSFSSNDHRGILYKHIRVQQGNKHVTLDKFDTDLYPETSLYWPHCTIGASPSTTLIGSVGSTPDVCLAATAVVGTPLSLTTQPRAPGQLLRLTVTSAAASGSIAITGTNQFGQATSETILASGNGTYYAQNVYSAVASSGIAITGLTSGSLAVDGFFATKWTFLMPSDPISTIACSIFTGTDSSVYPFGLLLSGDFVHDVDKQITISSKVTTQDQIALGDRTTNPLSTNRLATFGQPIDYQIPGWAALIYIDETSGTPGTTAYNNLLACKISVDTGAKETYVAKNQQVFDRFYREAPEVKFEAEVDFVNLIEYEHFRKFNKRLLSFKFLESNRYYGTSSGSIVQKYWQWTLPAKYQTFDKDRGKEKVQGKVKGIAEYSEALGYAAKLEIVNQAPPSYATA